VLHTYDRAKRKIVVHLIRYRHEVYEVN